MLRLIQYLLILACMALCVAPTFAAGETPTPTPGPTPQLSDVIVSASLAPMGCRYRTFLSAASSREGRAAPATPATHTVRNSRRFIAQPRRHRQPGRIPWRVPEPHPPPEPHESGGRCPCPARWVIQGAVLQTDTRLAGRLTRLRDRVFGTWYSVNRDVERDRESTVSQSPLVSWAGGNDGGHL